MDDNRTERAFAVDRLKRALDFVDRWTTAVALLESPTSETVVAAFAVLDAMEKAVDATGIKTDRPLTVAEARRMFAAMDEARDKSAVVCVRCTEGDDAKDGHVAPAPHHWACSKA